MGFGVPPFYTIIILYITINCYYLLISQRLAVVYHHYERKYNLRLMIYACGDDIQTKGLMIYHYSVMDKKMTAILYQNCSHFLVRETGLEPVHQRYTPLKRARLPIPPLPRTFDIIAYTFPFVNSFCKKSPSFFHLGDFLY